VIVDKNLKVAIVCDWLTGIGGAEQVVLELHKMFPKAPIYTSQYDPDAIDWFKDAEIITTWLNKLPRSLKKFFPIFRAISFSRLDLSSYDLVLSSSGAEAKAIKTGSNTVHVNYCHAPTHYYWTRYEAYLQNPGFGSLDWLARLGLRILVGPMRKWDYKAAQKPDYIIANSNYTRSEIKKYYKRDSSVIHPPVKTNKYSTGLNSSAKRNGYLAIGRQTPYKKIDLAVAACTQLSLDLTVIGTGPDNKKLREIAGPTITFLGQVSNEVKAKYLASSEAFIFPGVDDFGIAAIEALASGTPVIAYNKGGALDYVNEKTGLLFDKQRIAELTKALKKFSKSNFDSKYISNFSKQFSINSFKENMINYISSLQNRR
jgi:glycosyltransferase involved in cell wall biosynthesis